MLEIYSIITALQRFKEGQKSHTFTVILAVFATPPGQDGVKNSGKIYSFIRLT